MRMRQIIILWATCRPITFLKTHFEWINNADDPSLIKTRIAVDNEAQAKALPDFQVMITGNTKAGVCYPCYCLSSTLRVQANDIVVFASDDFFPPKGWDTALKAKVDLDKPCVLVVNDGIQKYPNKVVTIPILNYLALQKMNRFVYNPAYSHMWSDVELYEVAESLGIIKDIRKSDEFLMEHRHYCRGKRVKDEKDVLVDDKYREDKKIYESRKLLSTEEKIKVDESLVIELFKKEVVFHKPILSILICSLTNRKALLENLLVCLSKQTQFGVEILVEEDDGKIKIGKKRNLLLQRARGKYCCFVDDDDLVSDNYIEKILLSIKTDPDCCSLRGIMTTNGQNPVSFVHSIKYDHWFDETDDTGERIYYRCPNHLNVIRTSLCKKVWFNNAMNMGEDKDFSERIRPLLKKEAELKDGFYFYLYVRKEDHKPKQITPSISATFSEPVASVEETKSPPLPKPAPKKQFVLYAPWRN